DIAALLDSQTLDGAGRLNDYKSLMSTGPAAPSGVDGADLSRRALGREAPLEAAAEARHAEAEAPEHQRDEEIAGGADMLSGQPRGIGDAGLDRREEVDEPDDEHHRRLLGDRDAGIDDPRDRHLHDLRQDDEDQRPPGAEAEAVRRLVLA